MSHVKLHFPGEHEALVRGGYLINLVENSRHIKSAASSAISQQMLEDNKPDKDHFLLHVIAVGDYETYGFNRNGDAFTKEANVGCHPTFVKYGAYFHEHRHKCKKTESIGLIKASAYNPEMNRVELAVWGRLRPIDGFTKTAEAQYEKAKAGKQLHVSMSCRVAHDVCSICHNEAASPEQYCKHAKYHMGQYIPEHRKYAFVFNPNPKYFDISDVYYPAERIAHDLEIVFHKAASAGELTVCGSERARREGVTIPSTMAGFDDHSRQVILDRLIETETYVNGILASPGIKSADGRAGFCRDAVRYGFGGELTDDSIQKLKTLQAGTLFRKLAGAGAMLPFRSFAALFHGLSGNSPEVREAEEKHLSNLFAKTAACPHIHELENIFDPSSEFMTSSDLACSDEVQKIMDDVSEKHSIKTEPVKIRVVKMVINNEARHDDDAKSVESEKENNEKKASVLTDAENLATSYGVYKVAALKAMENLHGHEFLDDPRYILTVSQNLFRVKR